MWCEHLKWAHCFCQMNQSNAISVSFARELIHSKRFVLVVCTFQANVYLHWKSMIGNDHWSNIGYLMMNSFNENKKQQHLYLYRKKTPRKWAKGSKAGLLMVLSVFFTEMTEKSAVFAYKLNFQLYWFREKTGSFACFSECVHRLVIYLDKCYLLEWCLAACVVVTNQMQIFNFQISKTHCTLLQTLA